MTGHEAKALRRRKRIKARTLAQEYQRLMYMGRVRERGYEAIKRLSNAAVTGEPVFPPKTLEEHVSA